jgi:hypothetical protein
VAFNDARQLLGAGLFGVCPGGKFAFQIIRQFVLASRYNCFKGIHILFNAIDDGLAHADSGQACAALDPFRVRVKS